MSAIGSNSKKARSAQYEHELDRKLNAASGGFLFIWVGITLFASAGWGLGLVGVGFVVLGEQLARKYFAIEFEKPWVVAGLLIFLGGVVVMLGLESSIVPVLLIVIGVALLGSTVSRRQEGE